MESGSSIGNWVPLDKNTSQPPKRVPFVSPPHPPSTHVIPPAQPVPKCCAQSHLELGHQQRLVPRSKSKWGPWRSFEGRGFTGKHGTLPRFFRAPFWPFWVWGWWEPGKPRESANATLLRANPARPCWKPTNTLLGKWSSAPRALLA